MAQPIETLAHEALALPVAQRASLAHKLIESLDAEVDEQAETEWLAVIERRLQEMDRGQGIGRPIEDTIRGLRAKVS
jgi:putative addiction module component (TIGR02574 family)